MFSRDLILSVILHVVIFAVTLLAGPLDIRRPPKFAEVIRVGVVSMPEIAPAAPEPVPEVETPQAVQAEPEEIALDDPTTKPTVEIEEPVEKPEPKPKQQPSLKPVETGENDRAGTDDGQTEVPGPAGSNISGMIIGDADFNFPHWPSLAFSKINRYFYFSIAIDGKVYCDVHFEVIKSGRVIEYEVVKSSGVPAFDRACLAAIERASPLPPLPRKWLTEHLTITMTFTNH